MLSQLVRVKVIESTSRAPSLHNCQPFRVKFLADSIEVFEDLNRKLHIADPKSEDHELSLGVFLEGLRLALAENSLSISEQKFSSEAQLDSKLIKRVQIALSSKTYLKPDPLIELVHHRKTYRGVFENPTINPAAIKDRVQLVEGLKIIFNDTPSQWVSEYNKATNQLYNINGYWEELYSWMRFSKGNANYFIDGLNAKAMALSSIEAFFGQCFLQPSCFSLLQKLKLSTLLTSESAQIKSSMGFFLLTGHPGESKIELGRKFYQAWLQMSAPSIAACPMSSLVDTAEGRNFLVHTFKLKPDELPVAVWRFGQISESKVYQSPRVSSEELIMS